MVKIRRTRAAQICALLVNPGTVTLDQFNRDVWAFGSSTRLDAQDTKGGLFSETRPDPTWIQEFERALDAGRLELHGNYVWNPGSKILGAILSTNDEQEQEQEAVRVTQITTQRTGYCSGPTSIRCLT